MREPVRHENGVSDSRRVSPLGMFPFLDPTRFSTWYTDFHRSEGVTASTANDWTISKTEAGSGDAAVSLDDAAGGVLKIVNDTADDDRFFVQKLGEGFKWVAGKKMVVAGRFKLSDATETDFIFGLAITDTTPLDATDGIYFIKADGSTSLKATLTKNSSSSQLTAATMANDTYVDVAIVYQGQLKSSEQTVGGITKHYEFEVWAKNSDGDWYQVGSIDGTTNVCDDEELTITFGCQNGEASAKTHRYDYMLFAQER